MPHVDTAAKQFELTRAGWFGNAVSWRRKALKLTAAEVSRRTAELGYPISRGAVAKIESNLRSGKVDLAEVLVLAAALDIPPALLLFPQVSTDGGAVILPGFVAKEDDAVRWMAGQVSFPQPYDLGSAQLEDQPNPPNHGVNLLAAMSLLEKVLENRMSLVDYWHKVRGDAAEAKTAKRMLEKNAEQLEAVRKQIRDAREALWGMRHESDEPEEREGESDD
ncbi:transcriptional regulator [Mycobacterium kansasii]|uniref:helix-turn-helix domain-containing protein n=1 Tax=Mycobacterium kansasii TaxID=1768 RepID=UPI000CDDF30C|nr:helix-turn-helix transcriptional regulator [Mycobacterium kansasii]POX98885.1 transcriptional regulator [Mycobacterium kansasii]POY25304.1 transcriptional regulator [Mycobacterium kansasii]POY31342.1 transcriptional regulator [Mycobacterium kansasii]